MRLLAIIRRAMTVLTSYWGDESRNRKDTLTDGIAKFSYTAFQAV